MLAANPELPSAVKLDVRVVEADRVTNPEVSFAAANAADAIEFNAHGIAGIYFVLREHPGSAGPSRIGTYARLAHESMIHWFRADRPGQRCGIPEITTGLTLFVYWPFGSRRAAENSITTSERGRAAGADNGAARASRFLNVLVVPRREVRVHHRHADVRGAQPGGHLRDRHARLDEAAAGPQEQRFPRPPVWSSRPEG